MTHAELLEELRDLVASRSWDEIRDRVADYPPAELADLLLEKEKTQRILFFRALPRDLAGQVFSHLPPEARDDLLGSLTDRESREVLSEMEPDDRTRLLSELPAGVVRRLMDFLPREELEEARWLMGYPEESVGRLMTPDYVMVRPDWSVGRALDHIRSRVDDFETVNTLYVVDGKGTLLDAVGIRRLLLLDAESLIEDLVRGPVIALEAAADREEAVRAMERYDLPVLPVVDEAGVLLGIVTHDDVMDVAEGEFTEDMYRLAGINWSEEEVGRSSTILEASLSRVLKLRLPWLLVALAGGLMAGGVVGQFEETLEAVVILAFFIPVIMDMGGNVGTQASTIFVRGYALGHITDQTVWRHVLRETRTGLSVGLIMGAVGGIAAWAWQGIPELGMVIFVSMVATCTIASLVGFAVPWLAHRAGKDPAAVADPFITTIKDVSGLLIYFGLATWLLEAMV
jgi:magnesium transporter